MNDKQKQAVERLYDLRSHGVISEEDFYLFLEFVLNVEQGITYVPYTSPIDPDWWRRVTWHSGEPWNGNSITITADKVKLK